MLDLQILKFPHPFLRQKGQAVDKLTPELVELGRTMLQLMYESQGVGLAAIQVSKPVALIVADTRISFQSPYYKPEPEISDSPQEPSKRPAYSRKILSCQWESLIPQPLILFNPKVVEKEGEILFQEGCLSFPSYYAEVKRAQTVTVKALNPEGKTITVKTDGLLSICLQHEIDHLQGRLFIDHLSPLKSRRLIEEIKKHGYPEDLAKQEEAQ